MTGNLGFDLAGLIDRELVKLGDFIDGTIVDAVDLVHSGLTSLVDLVEKGFLDRFGFDPLAPITVNDILSAGIASLRDLALDGVLTLQNFTDKQLDPTDLTASGLVTDTQLAAHGLINMVGKVSLYDLVNSGLTA